jgi:hypothetical protein
MWHESTKVSVANQNRFTVKWLGAKLLRFEAAVEYDFHSPDIGGAIIRM